MRVLIVCSKNSGRVAPFIQEQVASLCAVGVDVAYFYVQRKGMLGYFKERVRLQEAIKGFCPDIIHAHYGLSGLLANLQRRVPVVTTYHGSDINNARVFVFSKIAIALSAFNIFVSSKNVQKSQLKKKYALVPCGVDTELFVPTDKALARKQLGLSPNALLVLFAGSFNNQVKNSTLAIQAAKLVPNVCLLELSGYTRQEVVLLMNAVDACLLTSFTEGSPQFIKEAMACGCPVVSVDVGDVAEVVMGVEGCYIASYEAADVAAKLTQALHFGKRTDGRKRILNMQLDSRMVAEKIAGIYGFIINN